MVRLLSSLACFAATLKAAEAENEGCAKFADMGFDLYDFEKYDTFFTELSVLALAQTGAYEGTEDIKEYMLFATEMGAFVDGVVINEQKMVYKQMDDPYDCIFLGFFSGDYTWSKERSGGETFRGPLINKIYYNSVEDKVTRVNFADPFEFLNAAFKTWDTPATHEYICTIMKDGCPDVWASSGFANIQECVDDLAEIPLLDNDLPITSTSQGGADGYSRACRMIHAALAAENIKHCPHISPKPIVDYKARTKCQPGSSAMLTHRDLFDESDDAEWLIFAKEIGFDSLDPGFKIVDADGQEVGGARLTSVLSFTAVALSSALLASIGA